MKLCAWWAGWLLVPVLLSGCRWREPERTEQSFAIPVWGNLPQMEALRLCETVARLQPQTSAALFSPQTGLLRLRVAQDKIDLPAGAIWAEFDTSDLHEELRRIAESKQRLERVIARGKAVDIPREYLKTQKALSELQNKKKLDQIVRSRRAQWDSLGIRPMGHGTDTESEQRLDEEIQQVKVALDLLDRDPEAAMGWNHEAARVELEEREFACRRKIEQATLRMPFAGRIELGANLLSTGGALPVLAGQDLAMAVQDERMELIVTPTPGDWLTLPPERVYATMVMPDGRRLVAPFSGTRYSRVFNRIELQSVFLLPAAESTGARLLAGTEVACWVWLRLPKGARIVTKISLALSSPDSCKNGGWIGAVSELWPTAKLLAEGDAELALMVDIKDGHQ
jgi:hypothetical protein